MGSCKHSRADNCGGYRRLSKRGLIEALRICCGERRGIGFQFSQCLSQGGEKSPSHNQSDNQYIPEQQACYVILTDRMRSMLKFQEGRGETRSIRVLVLQCMGHMV